MLPNYCTTFAATRAFTCHGNSRQILNHRSIIQQREFRELYINKQKNVMHFDPSANTKCHASKISNNRIYRLHKFMYIMFSRGATHCNLMSTHVSGNCIFRTLIFFFFEQYNSRNILFSPIYSAKHRRMKREMKNCNWNNGEKQTKIVSSIYNNKFILLRGCNELSNNWLVRDADFMGSYSLFIHAQRT